MKENEKGVFPKSATTSSYSKKKLTNRNARKAKLP